MDRAERGKVRAGPDVAIILPGAAVDPLWAISRRLLGALLILLLVVGVVLLDRDGYRDVSEDRIGVIDAFYYATVTLSTTGYGDITPASDTTRLVNVLVVTPARVLFLIILVGTTLEVLTERSREQFRMRRWRSRVDGHVLVCGYGTKGSPRSGRRRTSRWSGRAAPIRWCSRPRRPAGCSGCPRPRRSW